MPNLELAIKHRIFILSVWPFNSIKLHRILRHIACIIHFLKKWTKNIVFLYSSYQIYISNGKLCLSLEWSPFTKWLNYNPCLLWHWSLWCPSWICSKWKPLLYIYYFARSRWTKQQHCYIQYVTILFVQSGFLNLKH